MKRMILAICCLQAIPTNAQTNSAKIYNLFHSVPAQLMRYDMETDRPDVTESPYTVDAGHVQLESDVFRFKSGRKQGDLTRQYLFAPFTFKAGLTQYTDFQVALEAYRLEYHKQTGERQQHYGNCGSFSIRLKHNLIGNDSGKFALAIMPYVKLPANAFFEHHKFEGGVIVPAQWKILDKLALGFQEELDMVAEEEDYELQALQSVVVSYDIFDKLKGIAETYYIYNFGGHEMENYINVALQFFPVRNFAIDGGVLYGFQNDAEHNYYIGVAWRW